MKIMKVIHGYPPAYNAGSEVYSQTLCHELASSHEVHVFTREENPFLPDYSLRSEQDISKPTVTKHIVNLPLLRQRYRYRHGQMDHTFEGLLQTIKPDIIHVGHLNHLSTSLVEIAKNYSIPIVFTLHDYWLICPRGQFIQRNSEYAHPWKSCDGQEDRKCAEKCYTGYFSGSDAEWQEDSDYWTNWIARRQSHLRHVVSWVDLFVAPSQYLLERFQNGLSIPSSKLVYLDYGFDLSRLTGRSRQQEETFVWGYIGTHTPQKGIHLLLNAFAKLKGNSILRIWGRSRAEVTPGLQQIASQLPLEIQRRIEWLPEYSNPHIVRDVFNRVDAIVVPSVWVENSPLVIHEAQQVGVPVITANEGGMKEYVQHEVNGLLFDFRNENSLAEQMQRFIDNPSFAVALGKRRYLYSFDQNIPNIQEHVESIEKIYLNLLFEKKGIINDDAINDDTETRSLAYNF